MGVSIIDLMHCRAEFSFDSKILFITGIENAAVFPDPVLARANTSFPANANGIAFSCINVGDFHPKSAID